MPETSTEPVPEPAAARAAAAGSPRPSANDAERQALDGLLNLLDLRPAPGDDVDTFVGLNQPPTMGRVYGGQVLSQALVAAQRTVDPGRPVHSLHAYFLRAGDPGEPITFAVERLRDGRSFSARRTHALQFGRPILSMIASFQTPADGLDHQEPMPDVPPPEALPTVTERSPASSDKASMYWLRQRPMDLRYVKSPAFIDPQPDTAAWQAVWMRAVGALPDDPALHAAVLAYASDYALLEPVLRRHGRVFAEPGIKVASLDHAMWWHRPSRADEWLLYVLESPSASGARGLGQGRIFTRDGLLVCSVAQEGMVRVPQTPEPS